MKTLFFIFILCFLSSFLTATIINVSAGQSIQAGINAAANGDTVLVQPATYYGNINYNGKLITVGSLFLTTQDTTYISSTIIDGYSIVNVVTFENSEDSTAVLNGFTITNGSASDGGGIYCSNNSSPSLKDVTISGNSATTDGGGIYCNNSSPSLQNVTIEGNNASDGGGINCHGNANPILQDVTISGNSAVYGGGIHCNSSSPNLQNVTISGNSAVHFGGGIYCWNNSSPSLENVMISGNTANFYGGGIYCNSSSPSLQNVTISGNSANDGGGIYCDNSNPVLINSILWNDSPEEIYISSGSVTATYSDIQGGYTGTGNINADPLFVDPGNGDYHLQSISPCINAGDPASPLDPDGTRADMGAYYFHQLPPEADFTADTTNGEVPLTVNFTDTSVQGTGVIDEWYWDFGDSNNSSSQNPGNEYLLPGIYTVSLTVTDINDLTDIETKVDYITVIPPAYSGPVWHISTTGSDITGNGSEEYPFATIQHGIDFSADTDTVLVQTGTYFENINYNGKNITVASLFLTTQDTTYISSTIIDGNAISSVVTFESGEDTSALLCGFTITNGQDTYGGGIHCSNSSPKLENIILIINSASYGGGIYSSGPNLSLLNVTLVNNFAAYGGGIYSGGSTPSLENVIISNNSADNNGGGSCFMNSNPSLVNVAIAGNFTNNNGGGIYCWSANPILTNVTITDNTADYGGGIYCNNDSNPSLANTILWNDSPQEIYISSGSVTATYSDIHGGWAGTGNIDSDPLFVDPGNEDYHLQPASPCLDAGDPASPLDPDGTTTDMGAYYFHQYFGPVWHISTTGSDVTGNGSEQFPFATIQLGINFSTDTDIVLVQPGTYVENINYNGKLITVGSLFLTTQDTSYISSTIIDGNSSGSVVTFNHSEDSTTVLSGFAITNGLASGYPYHGGGIYCGYSSPSLQNVTISGNSANGSGGGIYCNHSSPSLQNVTISGNSGNFGGGIHCHYSSPNLQNVTISGNTAGSYSGGGGIYCNSSSPSLQNVTISGNSTGSYSSGGGIYCWHNSSPILQNITIIDNSASTRGGGFFCQSSSPSLTNVTISDNSATNGGGFFCQFSSPVLENVTISGNSSSVYGGGIYCDESNPILVNSILWNDSPQEIYIESGSVTLTYSDIQGGWTGTGNIDADPLFADPGNGDYHLTWANFPIPDATMSPCIDTGDPSSPLDPDATIADMGAFYFDKSPGAPVITDVPDVPDDQGRYVQVIWNRSPYDVSGSPVTIESYSVWRYDNIFDDRGIFEIYEDPQEIFEKATKDNDKNYYWQRDDEILTFITQLPAMGFAQYSVISPTLIDSSVVSINYSAFKVFAHTDITLIYYPSLPDSGYSIDNIAPDETRVYIAQNGTNIGLNWDEVEYGTFQGNSYPEVNGIWYKIYAGDFCDFICDEAHLVDTVTELYYDYLLTGEEKKFFKIVVSDQPGAGRSISHFNKPEKNAGNFQKVKTKF